MLRCAGEAVSLYSGSFKDLRVLSFMYEALRDRLELLIQDKHTMDSQAPAFGLPPPPFSDCVAPW